MWRNNELNLPRHCVFFVAADQASTLGHGTSMGGLLSPPKPAQLSAALKPTRKPAQKPTKN
jgi:hypothetical protein